MAVGQGSPDTSLPAPAGEDEFARLYQDARLGLVRLATLLTGDRDVGEDLVQDAFVGLHRRWAALADRDRAIGYLRVSVVNGSRSRRRRAAVARRHLRAGEPDDSPPADVAVLLADEHREVIDAVRRLPPRQREVLVLRYWLELGESEIARTMGISPGTVKSTASRALRAVERLLETEHDE